MKREIKFRAWDEDKEKMLTEKPENPVEAGVYLDFKTNFLVRWCGLTLMQFTGLKDKNGKEIYEGDVVEWKHLNNKGIVYYNSDEVQYFVKAINDSGETESYLDSTHMEIIGNIYENPELI